MLLYREKDYKTTCIDLKNIYHENGIKIDVNGMCTEGIYSYNCRISGTDLYSNGKGILPVQACASSLAEMIERLQNLTELSIKTKHLFNTDLIYWDTLMSYNELKNNSYSMLRCIFHNAEVLERVLDLLTQVYSNLIPCNYYKGICDGEIYGIPIAISSVLYGTNGMSAGNSFDESIEYAKYEISERMVNKAVYYDQYDNYIRLNPSLMGISKKVLDIINKIPYQVIFFMPQELTINVVGMLVLEKNSKKHIIKFGSHPNVLIAIERCVTELFQGRSLDELDKYMSFPKNKLDNFQDFHIIFRSGEGGYLEDTIERILKSQCNNCDSYTDKPQTLLSDNLLYRKLSFLGFPTVHCIIPAISEVRLSTYAAIKDSINEGLIFKALIRLSKLNVKEKLSLLEMLIDYVVDWKQPIKILLDLPIYDIDVLDYPIGFLMIGLGFQVGDQNLFSAIIDKFDIVDICSSINKSLFLDFSQLYFDNGNNVDKVKEYYRELQNQDDFNVMYDIYKQSIDTILNFPYMNCYRCYECEIQTNCKYKHTIEFYKKILNVEAKNEQNQN
jgi:ribosomal protein S12 methylthiotransferase accessory factor